ncbi:adhesion G protein-coupled receptor L3-like [Lytechinus variegatus]|uniref:adhesion G protein-coupled receptor L3-like n=1 Tax=Lytechinus variegatus TaxID=7654 RepID=UPI001BB10928|nr:adhesion G protein-coupled receptor L3-like [Lytechinus variegatus]
MDVQQSHGTVANDAEDIQQFVTTYEPVVRYIQIKIEASNSAYNCLRVEIYGHMNFEQWPSFNGTNIDDHIEYGTENDVHLECSCSTEPPIETFKADYYSVLSGTEIANELCSEHHRDTREVHTTAEPNAPTGTQLDRKLDPGSGGVTTGSIYTDIFSVELTSPAVHDVTSPPTSSWLCPDIHPDTLFTSTLIFREAISIRKGSIRFNYFLRGDVRTSWILYMRVWRELFGRPSAQDEVLASTYGSPGGSPGEWTEFYLEREFSENPYQLVAEFTIVADGHSLVAFELDSFQLNSESFTDDKGHLQGMKSLKISDHQISASSALDLDTGPTSARLIEGSGWCPSINDANPWIQVDMEREILLRGIMVQGRKNVDDWVTKYYIRVSHDANTWHYYDNLNYPTIFDGSWSSDVVVLQRLLNPMYCQFIRIYPVANNTNPCLRFDLTSHNKVNANGGSTVSPTFKEVSTTSKATTRTPGTTPNGITNAMSSTTKSTTPLAVLGMTSPGQVQNSTTVPSTGKTGFATPTDGPASTAGPMSSTTAAGSSTSGTQSHQGGSDGGGGSGSSPSILKPSTTTVSDGSTEKPKENVPDEIVNAKGVDEVFLAVTVPNITVSFETASAALKVVANLTHKSSSSLNKEDINSIRGTLTAVSSQAASTRETAQTFLDVVGSILVPNDTSTDSGRDVSENSTSLEKHASSMMEIVEVFATDAAKNLLSTADKEVVIQNDRLVLHLTKISPDDVENTTEAVTVSVNSTTNELHFPPSVFRGKNVTISAVVFNTLHLTSSSQLGGLHGNDTPTSVGSKIMSVQVEATDGSNITFSDDDPIEMVLELTEDANTTNTQSLCVFWEYLEDVESGGVWSTAGCHRNQTKGPQITCHCDHLTNFAILLQVNPNPKVLSLAHRVTLDMLTYIGLALSIAALVCTLTTFILLKLLKSQRTIIHANLCIALLSAQLLYLIGIERTTPAALCTTIAVLLHYLFTSTFSWMLMEGIYILMQSRSAYGKGGKTWMYMAAGWGSPVVIVAISLGVRLDGYGTDDYCWLSVENGLMWAFATPVLLVLAMNTIVLIMVIRVFMALKANLDKTEAERLR